MFAFNSKSFWVFWDKAAEWSRRALTQLSAKELEEIAVAVGDFEKDCQDLGLAASWSTMQRIWTAVISYREGSTPDLDLRDLSKELLGRLRDELGNTYFLVFELGDWARWNAPQPFGGEVFDRFPDAIVDAEEASKCLACGRATAAVFHLMRVMEAGLRKVAEGLGVGYLPGWDAYIKKINENMKPERKDRDKEWLRIEPFYQEVLGHLQAVKVAWRNPTMHVEKSYTLERATDISNAVRGFMRYMAEGLGTEKDGAK